MVPIDDGFPAGGLAFLEELAANNEREWFRANEERFVRDVREPARALVAAVDERLVGEAAPYRADPRKALGRMNRDVRFSQDKSPYRTDVFATFPRAGGRKEEVAGFFFRVAASRLELGGGVYVPGKPQLQALQVGIAERHEELRALVDDEVRIARFGPVQGERYARVPKGWPPDHPAGDLLRYKQLHFTTDLPREVLLSPGLVDVVATHFLCLAPFVAFLDGLLAADA